MFSYKLNKEFFKTILNKRFLRNDGKRSNILYNYADLYRPEIESELEYLSVQTIRNKSLQINYEIEQQRRRQRSIRYQILKRKYVAHPNDIKVDLYVKNHMQFLYKNYPKRWNVFSLAESFNQSVENVRLILNQRTTRNMRVRRRSPSTLFGINDEEEREKLVREHIIKRDISNKNKTQLEQDDEDLVDYRVLAEETNLQSRQRPSDTYMKRDNDGFFSNVISSEDENQQNERDTSIKKKFLTSSLTLLDRINKLRLNTNPSDDTYSNDQTNEIYTKRMNVIEQMKQENDAIAQLNERRKKYLKRTSTKN